jgi:hypothetical protein
MRPRWLFRSTARNSSRDRPDAEARDRLQLVEGAAGVAEPAPEIMGTYTPQAAARGARTIDVLSPTPPVECLSTLGPGSSPRSSTSPVRIIDSVSATVSRAVMPLKKTAMARAEAW